MRSLAPAPCALQVIVMTLHLFIAFETVYESYVGSPVASSLGSLAHLHSWLWFCTSFSGPLFFFGLTSLPLCLICWLWVRPFFRRRHAPLGLARFIGIRLSSTSQLHIVYGRFSLDSGLPMLCVARRTHGKLKMASVDSVKGITSRSMGRAWLNVRRRAVMAGFNVAVQSVEELSPLPIDRPRLALNSTKTSETALCTVSVIDANGQRFTLLLPRQSVENSTLLALLVTNGLATPAMRFLCHFRLGSRVVPFDQPLVCYKGESIGILVRILGGALSGSHWSSQKTTAMKTMTEKASAWAKANKKGVCERYDLCNDIDGLPEDFRAQLRRLDAFAGSLDLETAEDVIYHMCESVLLAQTPVYQEYICGGTTLPTGWELAKIMNERLVLMTGDVLDVVIGRTGRWAGRKDLGKGWHNERSTLAKFLMATYNDVSKKPFLKVDYLSLLNSSAGGSSSTRASTSANTTGSLFSPGEYQALRSRTRFSAGVDKSAEASQEWSEAKFKDNVACVRQDFATLEDLPPSLIAQFQILIDNRYCMSLPIFNQVLDLSMIAWANRQDTRFQAYLKDIVQPDARRIMIRGVQLAWEKIIGPAPNIDVRGYKGFWGTFRGIKDWFMTTLANNSEIVLPEARQKFTFDSNQTAFTTPAAGPSSLLNEDDSGIPQNNTRWDRLTKEDSTAGDFHEDESADEVEPDDDPEFDPTTDEFEPFFLDWLSQWWERAARAAKDAGRKLSSTKVWIRHVWPPRIPRSKPCNSREDILSVIRERLLYLSWHGGHQGFSTDKALIERHLDWFMDQFLSAKSFDQLEIIQSLPDCHITPALLERAGLISAQAGTEQHAIYIKFIPGLPNTLDRMSRSAREDTAGRAAAFAEFLADDTIPDHLLHLNIPARNPQQPWLSHVGRFCRGKNQRHRTEYTEAGRFDVERGARFWCESVVAGGGAAHIQYWILTSADHLSGQTWCDHMRWSELFFAGLHCNYGLTNLTWPGLDCPAAPVVPGAPGMTREEKVGRGDDIRSQALGAVIEAAYGIHVDPVSALCLLKLGYEGDQTPEEYLRALGPMSKGRNVAVVFGAGVPFKMSVSHSNTRYSDDRQWGGRIMLDSRMYACALDEASETLVIRPIGTQPRHRAAERTAIDLALHSQCAPSTGYFADVFAKGRKVIDVAIVPHPVTGRLDQTQWSLRATRDSSFAVSGHDDASARVLRFPIQIEAAELLLGKVSSQDLQVSALQRSRNFKPRAANTTIVGHGHDAEAIPISPPESLEADESRSAPRASTASIQWNGSEPMPEQRLEEWKRLKDAYVAASEAVNVLFLNTFDLAADDSRIATDSDLVAAECEAYARLRAWETRYKGAYTDPEQQA